MGKPLLHLSYDVKCCCRLHQNTRLSGQALRGWLSYTDNRFHEGAAGHSFYCNALRDIGKRPDPIQTEQAGLIRSPLVLHNAASGPEYSTDKGARGGEIFVFAIDRILFIDGIRGFFTG